MAESEHAGRHPPADLAELARRLEALGYVELFHRRGEDAINSVWGSEGGPQTLRQLAADPASPSLARFLAAEVLSYKDKGYPAEGDKRALAPVYAEALARNYTVFSNAWGLPGTLDGQAAQNAFALGEAAVPELLRLLGDEMRMSYSGSEEATVGNSYAYRVKDAAAFLISRIRGLPFEVHESPRERDAEIEKLKGAL